MTDNTNAEPQPSTKKVIPKDKDYTTLREMPLLYVKAFIIGAADVVPGVSGGTMGLILGIYKRMIDAIKSIDAATIKSLLKFDVKGIFAQVHWKFGLTLMLGIFSALIFFTRVVPLPVFMYSHPEIIYGLFFGLILGSVVLLLADLGKMTLRAFLAILVGTVAGYWIVTLVPTDTPDNPLFLILTGSISISALILPGISGSFLLLVLQKYDTVMTAIGQLGTMHTLDALWILIPFGIGTLLGLGVFSRILSWLLNRYYLVTLCLLIGFMAGSLYIIWPFQEREYIQTESTRIVEANSELARQAALSAPTERAPSYLQLGEVVNPEAPRAEQQVEVIVVNNKLISSSPFVPSLEKAPEDQRLSEGKESVYNGYIMISVGLIAVLLLGFITRLKAKQRPGRSGAI